MKRLGLVLGILFATTVGFFGGKRLTSAVLYQQGRVSACKDMLGVLTQLAPILLINKVECVPYNGDAAMKLGDEYWSLDGSKKLN